MPSSLDVAARRTTGAARSTLDKPWAKNIARMGILSRAVNYLALTVLVGLILAGRGNQEADRRGAVEALASKAIGRGLLVLLCVGFVAYIAWQLLRAVTRRSDQGPLMNAARRCAALGIAVAYGAFLVSTVLILAGSHTSSPQKNQQALTARLLSENGGRFAVALAGAVLVGTGIGLCIFAVMRRFETPLDTERMGKGMRRLASILGVTGQSGRALVLTIIGGFVISAAISQKASQSKGLDESLHTLAGQPFGAIMLMVVALGFLSFGLYSLVDARYRKDFSR
ncbi:MAG: DUF1206 domain-containing protein [Gammaproteobacteria bacterium]|nr:DUF1206 domain-containing protein [Gammaproteobacteria bacterium]